MIGFFIHSHAMCVCCDLNKSSISECLQRLTLKQAIASTSPQCHKLESNDESVTISSPIWLPSVCVVRFRLKSGLLQVWAIKSIGHCCWDTLESEIISWWIERHIPTYEFRLLAWCPEYICIYTHMISSGPPIGGNEIGESCFIEC